MSHRERVNPDSPVRPPATAAAMAVDHIDLTVDASSDCATGSASETDHSHVPGAAPSWRDPLSIVIESPSNRKSPSSHHQSIGRGPISPPALKRSSASAINQPDHHAVLAAPASAPPDVDTENVREMAKLSGLGVVGKFSQQMTPPATSHPSKPRQTTKPTTPKAQTPKKQAWDVAKIVESLTSFRQDIKDGHAELATYMIDSTVATERRVLSGPDLFANVNKSPVVEEKGRTMRVKFKVSQYCPYRTPHSCIGYSRSHIATLYTWEEQKRQQGRALPGHVYQDKQRTRPPVSFPSRGNQKECIDSQHHVDLCPSFERS